MPGQVAGVCMRSKRSRWLFRIAIVLVAGAAFLVWAVGGLSQPSVTVENQSGQVVSELHVTVAEEQGTFRNVAQGATVTVPFAVPGRGPFTVKVTLGDGPSLRTSRMEGKTLQRGRFIILPGGGINFRP